jgi:hypothetical protein
MKLAQFCLASASLAATLIASTGLMAQSDGIVVYNAQHASLTKEWAAAFTRDTGIKVTIRDGGDTELGNQILQEGKSSPADVFLTENSPAMVLPAGPRALDRHSSAQHRVRLQQEQTDARQAPEVDHGSRRSFLERPLGGITRRR